MKNKKKKLIVLSGGGTGGSVTPLLAVYQELKQDDSLDFIFVGTKKGPEKALVEQESLAFVSILSGKWRRYFSWQNFFDLFKIFLAFFQSLCLFCRWRPKLLMSAGGFVSVPLAWAAKILGVPVLIHQQDIRPGLANKLMAWTAKKITVSFEKSLHDYGSKAVWLGNPVKKEVGESFLSLDEKKPLLLVVGGGTGSASINQLISEIIDQLLSECQVVHIIGEGKGAFKEKPGYYPFPFLSHARLITLLEKSDLVLSRAGLGLISELSYYQKPSIIIPMPDSHQEDNAKILADKGAALVLSEKDLSAERLLFEILELLKNKSARQKLGAQMSSIMKREANKSMAELVKSLIV